MELPVPKDVRCVKNMHSLVELGYADAHKGDRRKQVQWLYRVTIRGRIEAEKLLNQLL